MPLIGSLLRAWEQKGRRREHSRQSRNWYKPEALKPDVDPEVTRRLTNFYSQTFWCNIGAFKCTQAIGRQRIAFVAVRHANPIPLWSIAFASYLTTRLIGIDPSVSAP